MAGMTDEIEEHIADVSALYEPLLNGQSSKLVGGSKLWSQFESAVSAFRKHGRSQYSAVREKINEMAVAHLLLSDSTLANATISYEPDIAKDGSRIDFVVNFENGRTMYLEVKTVHPRADDNLENWNKYLARRQHHPNQTDFVVFSDFLGPSISKKSFDSRSKFLTYCQQFESRLEQAHKILSGDGVLVFCGTGEAWHVSELKDFADYYHSGVHRPDDVYSKMEGKHILDQDIQLKRNIMAFAFVKRQMHEITASNHSWDVRGPK